MLNLFKSHTPRIAKRPKAAPDAPAAAPAPKTPEDLARAERAAAAQAATDGAGADGKPRELGGPDGPEPTRYGDWERKGICYDF